MASFNKVLLMGNLVRDPELRVTPSGLSICHCTIACSRSVKTDNGMKEETTFVDVESFGKQAETVAKHFVKGKPILVEGRLRLNEWQNSAGEKRSKLVIVMENFVFVGPSSGQNNFGETKSSFNYDKIDHKDNAKEDIPLADNNSDEDIPF